MGLFSSAAGLLSKVAKSPVLSDIATIAGGPIGSGASALASYYMARKEASKQRKFQLGMSNTGYQRATADMRAAGLNPMLAYQQGPASSMTGAAAAVPDMAGSINTGFRNKIARQELRNLEIQQNNLDNTGARIAQDYRIKRPDEARAKVEERFWNMMDEWGASLPSTGRGWLDFLKAVGGLFLGGKALKRLKVLPKGGKPPRPPQRPFRPRVVK